MRGVRFGCWGWKESALPGSPQTIQRLIEGKRRLAAYMKSASAFGLLGAQTGSRPPLAHRGEPCTCAARAIPFAAASLTMKS